MQIEISVDFGSPKKLEKTELIRKKLINYLKKENNDLEKTVIKIYPKVGKIDLLYGSRRGIYE